MEILYLGHSSFKITGRTGSVITDPFDPAMVGIRFGKQKASIVTVSHGHLDHNQVSLVEGVRKVIDGPGEYEIENISIIGISSFHDDKKGELRGSNTMYVIEMDGFRVAHLGDLGHELAQDDISSIGSVDILMIPTGGHYTIDSSQAAKIAHSIEASIMIPMHFKDENLKKEEFGMLESVDEFVSQMGLPSERLPRLSLKDRESVANEGKIVILSYGG